METRDLIDVNEGSRLTGLSTATLYKLSRQRRLRSFKVLGTALRFDRQDLLALVEEKRQTSFPGRLGQVPQNAEGQ